MNRVYILLVFLLPVMTGCMSVGGFYRENSVLVGIIEKSVGKPVNFFYDQLTANKLNPEQMSAKPMEDEEHREFGIEMKIPPQVKASQSQIVVRLRFDMRREIPGQQIINDSLHTKRPEVFVRNGMYAIEFIRVLEYKNKKITFSRIFDKSTGYSVPVGDELVAADRLKRR